MAGTFPQNWSETALVTIERYPGTANDIMQATAITETIDISEPDYGGESIPNLAGGRIWKQTPQEDGEITFEIYPVAVALDTDLTPDLYGGLFQFFATNQTIDITSPTQPVSTAVDYSAGVDYSRERFRVAIMWTNDVAATSASGATSTADAVGLRFAALSCRLVSHKAAYTDGILKVTATFKFPAMNKAGTVKMFRWESTNDGDGASALAALGTYDDDDSWT
jgi:hypothetical protein